MFQINEVLSFDQRRYRILQLMGEHLVWIDIDDKSAFPEIASTDELRSAIEDEVLDRVQDPFSELTFLNPAEGSTAKTKRDRNYALIKPLLDLPDFYDPESRGAAINTILTSNETTKQTIYRLARRYWQRGQVPNALLPDYKNSGAKGQRRLARDKKLGRPRKYTPGVGAKVDEFTERLFRIAIDRYLLKDQGHSLPYAHRRFEKMYLNYFPDTPSEELPSNWQMMHFYKREYQQADTLKKRVSAIEFNKDVRPLRSTANTQVLGPGSRYEIDATIADIYLVSDSERGNIVGRPVVYMVVDVFSRMVAGFYIGFETPSYAAAMQALFMAVTEKTSYCKEMEFDVDINDWPSVGVPDAVLADRGELLGHQIENLESNFSVRIENTPPYRGDAKGIVERNFKTIQSSFGPFVPGHVSGSTIKKRGGKDYRLDAKLSVRDFSQIILSSVLCHNQYAVLEKYDREADMPTDLPATPIHLWNWGLQHRTGRLHQADPDALRIALLPRKRATLSELGPRLFGVYYSSTEFLRLGWTHRGAHVKRPASIEAAYDPLVADRIYLFPEKGSNKYWICNLSERSREFRGCSFWDVWQARDEQKNTAATAKVQLKTKKRQHEEFVIEKIAHAEKSAPDTSAEPKVQRIRAINENKRHEKAGERAKKAHRPEAESERKSGEIVHLAQPEADLDYPDFIDELFEDDD
ncbi:Transposon Tn7 transposition protein TnsB [Pseudovibrio sp. Ad13]|uniref:DDE-type integrase/transposase/recombinase n=1 Tax=Pseudovibrio sp. Ad13 TaxID=989396 RepID=UPI0007AED5E7|nr:DDE-type integrase/transposase/recombinase [Pseudovibrio sp. Ad13]KZK82601.1 Transposon Tn7 transposition protein TnsB [Pseudovibrio sp. Ad13]